MSISTINCKKSNGELNTLENITQNNWQIINRLSNSGCIYRLTEPDNFFNFKVKEEKMFKNLQN